MTDPDVLRDWMETLQLMCNELWACGVIGEKKYDAISKRIFHYAVKRKDISFLIECHKLLRLPDEELAHA